MVKAPNILKRTGIILTELYIFAIIFSQNTSGNVFDGRRNPINRMLAYFAVFSRILPEDDCTIVKGEMK